MLVDGIEHDQVADLRRARRVCYISDRRVDPEHRHRRRRDLDDRVHRDRRDVVGADGLNRDPHFLSTVCRRRNPSSPARSTRSWPGRSSSCRPCGRRQVAEVDRSAGHRDRRLKRHAGQRLSVRVDERRGDGGQRTIRRDVVGRRCHRQQMTEARRTREVGRALGRMNRAARRSRAQAQRTVRNERAMPST